MPIVVLRNRVLFETAYLGGARAFEVCGMYVEDVGLRRTGSAAPSAGA